MVTGVWTAGCDVSKEWRFSWWMYSLHESMQGSRGWGSSSNVRERHRDDGVKEICDDEYLWWRRFVMKKNCDEENLWWRKFMRIEICDDRNLWWWKIVMKKNWWCKFACNFSCNLSVYDEFPCIWDKHIRRCCRLKINLFFKNDTAWKIVPKSIPSGMDSYTYS